MMQLLEAALLVLTLNTAPTRSNMPLCSVVAEDGTRGPDISVERTRKLVRDAEVIVRAKALRELPLAVQHGWLRTNVEFEILEVLKGRDISATLRIPGRLVETDDFNPGPVPYLWPRRQALMGSCHAYTYRAGGEFLLLLRSVNGWTTPYWVPLAPTNEQIQGPEDPWALWVRQQLAP